MADQVYVYQVTTPAGTALASPQTTSVAIPVRIVRRITIKVPPGPAGHLGFQVAANGTAIIPVNGTSWIVTDNEDIVWDVTQLIESGAFQIRSYNTGIYPHTIEIRFEVDIPPPKPASTAPRILEIVA